MSVLEAMAKTLRMKRDVSSLYTGIVPALLSTLMFRAVKFATFAQVQELLTGVLRPRHGPTLPINIIAGIATGE